MEDKDPMPFGKHKGKMLQDVPASYLVWLMQQEWAEEWPELYDYLCKNEGAILQELKEGK